MMLPNFVGIRHFSATTPVDNWGDASKIDRGLLLKADRLREALATPIIVTSGYRKESMGSQHALGLALDIMFPLYDGTLAEAYVAAEKIGFKGIGVYPHWKYKGEILGGLHIDERLGKHARWMGILKPNKGGTLTQQYIALNAENFKLYGVI